MRNKCYFIIDVYSFTTEKKKKKLKAVNILFLGVDLKCYDLREDKTIKRGNE